MSNVNLKRVIVGLAMSAAIAVPTMMPTLASAQTSHRQKSKNQWRNLGIAGGVLGAVGLVKHNNTLAAAGLAGGAYSAYRYEQDRKSQRHQQDVYNRRHRAQRFSRSTRHRYVPSGTSWHHDNGLHKGWYKHHV